jgi:hypothetical protein
MCAFTGKMAWVDARAQPRVRTIVNGSESALLGATCVRIAESYLLCRHHSRGSRHSAPAWVGVWNCTWRKCRRHGLDGGEEESGARSSLRMLPAALNIRQIMGAMK